MQFFVGITGASGHVYAEALVRALVELGHGVDLSLTAAGAVVLRHERGVQPPSERASARAALDAWLGPETAAGVDYHPPDAIEAPPSSGTHLSGGVVLCPCSMGTLARVAAGFSSNLVERAADVALKEGRRLILVPRESPLSEIHLENLLRMARLGAVVLPAAPGFYHRPTTVEDLVDHVVGKVLDRLGIDSPRSVRWSGPPEPEEEEGIGSAGGGAC